MTLRLNLESLYILYTLQAHDYEVYIVGGAVRDLIRASWGITLPENIDYDFTTNALPEQIQALFPEHFYENTFGTVSVTPEHLQTQMGVTGTSTETTQTPTDTTTNRSTRPRVIDLLNATKIHSSLPVSTEVAVATTLKNEPAYQITTFRSDEVYADFRRPTSMTWGTSLSEDLERRDFTINALALQVDQSFLAPLFETPPQQLSQLELLPPNYRLIDHHQSLADLKAEQLRAVGNPHLRFREDALRMLRAIRFAVQLNVVIEPQTYQALQDQAELITHISAERVREELLKMVASNYPAEAIELLDEVGLLPFILPELELTKGVEQGGHHTTDVWTHSLDALRTCPARDPIVRLATLLHDIAKPQTQQITDRTISFYNHEVIGARVAKKIAERLRLSKKDCDRIFTLVRFHMFYYQPENTDASIRRFMRKVGLENIDDILDLREGDRLGSGARQTSWRLEEMKQRMIEQLHQPFSTHDLAIDGHDLMTAFGLKPGPILGQLLNQLFEKVLENPELNTSEQLLAEAKELLKNTEKI